MIRTRRQAGGRNAPAQTFYSCSQAGRAITFRCSQRSSRQMTEKGESESIIESPVISGGDPCPEAGRSSEGGGDRMNGKHPFMSGGTLGGYD